MELKLLLSTLLLLPSIAAASACHPPQFEDFAADKVKHDSKPYTLLVEMQPVAELRIPSEFSKVGVLPNGSVGFGQHPNSINAVFGFETKESLSVHMRGTKPALFMLSVFKGLDSVGCRYLQGYQLESEDYRLHANLEHGAELFAYGKGDRHQFYLIRPDQPDYVLSGMFRKIDRAEFESILSTLVIK